MKRVIIILIFLFPFLIQNCLAEVIVAGIDENYPPHEFVEDGEAKGFNVDIMKAIALEMDREIIFKPMVWHKAMEALKNESIDILCMAAYEERKQYFDFSKPILDLKLAIFVKEEVTGITNIEDLAGHSVAVQKGDIAEEILQERKIDAYIIETGSQDDALKLVANGDVTAFLGNYYTGIYLIHKHDYKNIKVIGEMLTIGQRVIAVKKGNDELLADINAAINSIKASGVYDKIYEKWYGMPVYVEKGLPQWILYSIFGIFGLIGIAFIMLSLWNRALAKKVDERTAELQEYKDNLEEKVRDRTTEVKALTYALAHDLKAPLRSIQSFAFILSNEYMDILDEEGKDALERIVSATKRMEMLINDLLEYGRIERRKVEKTNIDMNELVEEIIKEMEELIRERDAEIKISELPCIKSDYEILKRIMINLIHNAVKFVEKERKPMVKIYGEGNDMVKIFVEDNGIGIPEECQQKIFELFERLHGREEYEGTGIGLAMVKKGVEKLGGKVGVKSVLNKGSIFWIELPRI